jgi:hypothetical protein
MGTKGKHKPKLALKTNQNPTISPEGPAFRKPKPKSEVELELHYAKKAQPA